MKLKETRDREKVVAFLKEDHIGNLSILGTLKHEGDDVRTYLDNLQSPSALLVSNRWKHLYTRNTEDADKILRSLPEKEEQRFAALAGRYVALLKDIREIEWDEPCVLFFLDRGEFKPSGTYETAPLKKEHAPLVAEHWEHGKEEAEEYVAQQIERGPTCAIYENGGPVSWALTHRDGQMGFMYTRKEYRGRGMAAAITSALSEEILSRGEIPFLHVVQDNGPAMELVKNAGFRPYGEYHYISAKPVQ